MVKYVGHFYMVATEVMYLECTKEGKKISHGHMSARDWNEKIKTGDVILIYFISEIERPKKVFGPIRDNMLLSTPGVATITALTSGAGKSSLLRYLTKGIKEKIVVSYAEYVEYNEPQFCVENITQFVAILVSFLNNDDVKVMIIDSLSEALYKLGGTTGGKGLSREFAPFMANLNNWLRREGKTLFGVLNPFETDPEFFESLENNLKGTTECSFIIKGIGEFDFISRYYDREKVSLNFEKDEFLTYAEVKYDVKKFFHGKKPKENRLVDENAKPDEVFTMDRYGNKYELTVGNDNV